jgi:hypothetical protein
LFVFDFIKGFLAEEYENIHVANDEPVAKSKKTKIRKRTIQMTLEYFRDIST